MDKKVTINEMKLKLDTAVKKATQERIKQMKIVAEAEQELHNYVVYLVLSKQITKREARTELGVGDFALRRIIDETNKRNTALMRGENV